MLLEQALRFIENHITETLSLTDIAGALGYSPYHFSRLFTGGMRIPVMRYVAKRKLQYAVRELLRGEKVVDVAMLYGFESHEVFTRAFKRYYGILPKDTGSRFGNAYRIPPLPRILYESKGAIPMKAPDGKYGGDDLHSMLLEVLENSLAEAQAGFCGKIWILLDQNGMVSISDDGRGIPCGNHPATGRPIVEQCLMGDGDAREILSAADSLRGVGLAVVNALSKWLKVTVRRDGKRYEQHYVNGEPVDALTVAGDTDETGMQIDFIHNDSYFSQCGFQFDALLALFRALIPNKVKNLTLCLTDQHSPGAVEEQWIYKTAGF